MTDETVRRLRVIALIGAVLLVSVAAGSVFPDCFGCGSLTFEGGEPPAEFEERQKELVTAAAVGTVVILTGLTAAQVAWRRHQNNQPLRPNTR